MSVARRPYHHGSLRLALLEAAERALERDGASGLSLRELSRELGVSHAAPRRHFADKQALLDALAIGGFEALGEKMDAAIATRRGFARRFADLARAYMTFAAEHAALLELMYASKHRDDAHAAAADRAFRAPLRLIAEGQASGDVRAGDPERIGIGAWSAVHGLAMLAANGMLAGDQREAALTETVELALRGLRP